MLRLSIISAVLLLSLAALGFAEQSQPNDLMNIVAQIDNEHVAAWNAKNPKNLIDLFTDDAVVISENGGGGFTNS